MPKKCVQNQNIFFAFLEELNQAEFWETSTGLYRSCAALASFSGTFDLILFQAVNFEFIAEKVWFAYFKDTQTHRQTYVCM